MNADSDPKVLAEALVTVKTNLGHMKRCLDSDQLMDALKAASTMLAELRTSALQPKQYYELYMAVFDALRHLSSYLYDAHVSGRHHLADLYELVQYAGNIVPRLYLMITVGTVYMSIPGAPVKEIMKDMMEMARGVQHPTRGLFLRHYLSGMTRNYLPVGNDPGPGGNLQDSIGFVLTNFIEMNKLWVRLQHAGLTRDREKRELERRELRILVGTNLVRLSQLDGVDLNMYAHTILPSILEQVVNCKDQIAQEYLMEVIIQVFTDEFHLNTLDIFLSAVAQLHPKVSVKSIVIALIDRLAAFAAREAENESPEDRQREEAEAAKRLEEEVKRMRDGGEADTEEAVPAYTEPGEGWGGPRAEASEKASTSTATEEKEATFRGIPTHVRLFEVFWAQIVQLIKARPDLSLQDITALLVSLTNLSLSCYPDKLLYIHQLMVFALTRVRAATDASIVLTPPTVQNLLALLLAPIQSYYNVLTVLAIPSYHVLLHSQPFSTRYSVAQAIVESILKNNTVIDEPSDVSGILRLCSVLIKGPKESGSRAASGSITDSSLDQLAEEQGWLARMVHLFVSKDVNVQFELLQMARREFSEGGSRIKYTFPPLITAAIKLARRGTPVKSGTTVTVDAPASAATEAGRDSGAAEAAESQESGAAAASEETQDTAEKVSAVTGTPDVTTEFSEKQLQSVFRFIHQSTLVLYNKVESSEICLRLFLLALSAADGAGLEELAYEFAVQAFSVYEESISESRAQLQAITLIIGSLQTCRVFTEDNYDTLITKAALHGAKLLKKGQQATAVALASHMWWQQKTEEELTAEGKEQTPVKEEKEGDTADGSEHLGTAETSHHTIVKDGKRVLECLQKSLRIATTSIDELTSVQLFCDALDQYLYYFEQGVDAISPRHINSLVELVTTNLDALEESAANGDTFSKMAAVSVPIGLLDIATTTESVTRHLRNTLLYIQSRKEGKGGFGGEIDTAAAQRFGQVDVAGSLLKLGVGN